MNSLRSIAKRLREVVTLLIEYSASGPPIDFPAHMTVARMIRSLEKIADSMDSIKEDEVKGIGTENNE